MNIGFIRTVHWYFVCVIGNGIVIGDGRLLAKDSEADKL
jgi:hypothetical protein